MKSVMSNNQKLKFFSEIAIKLNQELSSTPVLYGSLGLSCSVGVDFQTDDIDLLIEESIFTNQLPKIHRLMDTLGYTLTNAKENEFERGSIKVGIASDGDMLSFTGINPASLVVETCTAKFRVLSPEQYLATYKASSLDGYRKDTKLKDDQSKIKLIESVLQLLEK